MKMVQVTLETSILDPRINQPKYYLILVQISLQSQVISAWIKVQESRRLMSQSSTPLHLCMYQVERILGNANQLLTYQKNQRPHTDQVRMTSNWTTVPLSSLENYLMIEPVLMQIRLPVQTLISLDCTRQKALMISMAFLVLLCTQKKKEGTSTMYGLLKIII